MNVLLFFSSFSCVCLIPFVWLLSFFLLTLHFSDVEVADLLQYGRHAWSHPRIWKFVTVQGCTGLYYAKQRYMIDTSTNTDTCTQNTQHGTFLFKPYSIQWVLQEKVSMHKSYLPSTQLKSLYLDAECPAQYAPLNTVVSCLGWTYLQGQLQSV